MGRPYINQSLVHPNFKSGAGTCAHCGHAILNIYQVQIGNGDVYGVGSDCIAKVGLPARELSLVKREELKQAKLKRDARKKAKGDAARLELKQLLESRAETLRTTVHGERSLFDYATYCLGRSNDNGICIVLKKVKYLLASNDEIIDEESQNSPKVL
jgi:hypothetical protein